MAADHDVKNMRTTPKSQFTEGRVGGAPGFGAAPMRMELIIPNPKLKRQGSDAFSVILLKDPRISGIFGEGWQK